jgi:putative radical SAM enzyme (TIGR03279 family)
MALRIKEVAEASWAESLGLVPGERVLSINGHRIIDFIDLGFYSGDEILQLEIERLNGSIKIFAIHESWEKPIGIIAEDHACRQCANNCIFCFIDQMPKGLRKSLYIKDDDTCFSFYYGNFITLTNLTDRDYRKIIEQYLSPLYISVHTTNSVLHKEMLGYSRDFNIMGKLRFLVKNDISFHTQIVVVPGFNDGEELNRSLSDLDSLDYNCLSIGVVPVGLTQFRQDLAELRVVNSAEAEQILIATDKYRRTWCSDEIYIKAGREIPEAEYYEDFEQLENGIGMIRMLMMNWQEEKSDFFEDIKKIDQKLVFVTGMLAEGYIQKIVADINADLPEKARVQSIRNDNFGEDVTVTGLLTWQDIEKQLVLGEDEVAVFASNTFNTERFTIDGVSAEQITAKLGGRIVIIDEQFQGWEFLGFDS